MSSYQRVKDEDKNITKEALLYNDIYKYLLEGAYREEATKDEKRIIRRSAALFFVKDGLYGCFERTSCEKKQSSG